MEQVTRLKYLGSRWCPPEKRLCVFAMALGSELTDTHSFGRSRNLPW